MAVKESILRQVRILITNQFDTPEEALRFFDSEKEGVLKKHELKKMLRAAVVNDFIRGSVARELLKGYDEPSEDVINWNALKVEISAFEGSLSL
jgi:Ca2+-binding EF-hand superfamily protein